MPGLTASAVQAGTAKDQFHTLAERIERVGDDERLHIELVRRGGERDKSRELVVREPVEERSLGRCRIRLPCDALLSRALLGPGQAVELAERARCQQEASALGSPAGAAVQISATYQRGSASDRRG